MENKVINIEWVKCHHGIEKRHLIPCTKCEEEKRNFLSTQNMEETLPIKIPIRRGCKNRQCFCDGTCNDIIGYRDPLFIGER